MVKLLILRRKIRSLEELNKDMRKYFSDISRIYSKLIKESPDNIRVGEKYYDYAVTPNAYTGFINSSGKYVVSKDIVGHSNLRYEINKMGESEKEDQKKLFSLLKTNAKTFFELKQILTDNTKIRIWKDQKVFSMWNDYKPIYREAIINVLSGIGEDYTSYKYDNDYLPYEEMPTYETFLVSELSSDEKEQIEDKEYKQMQRDKEFANVLVGNVPKRSIDIDAPYKVKTPTWMSRQGD